MVSDKTKFFFRHYVISLFGAPVKGFVGIFSPTSMYNLSILIMITVLLFRDTATFLKIFALVFMIYSHIRYRYSITEWREEYKKHSEARNGTPKA